MGKIIIIEDDSFIRDDLRRIIRKIDKEIEIFETGSVVETMEIIEDNEIDILLMDIQLEDGNGYELAKKIRQMEQYKLKHIVFITAVPTHALNAYENTHCYSYILKPIDQGLLEDQLHTLIKYGTNKSDKVEDDLIELDLKSCKYVVNAIDILYMEAINQKKYIKTTKECIELSRINLTTLIDKLPNYFVRCHKSFVVNFKRIEHVNKTERTIKMEGVSEIIPIGRKYYTDVMEKK
jgi:DNA-binding LytR/AlgR family response regulator